MTRDRFSNKAEAFEAHDDIPTNAQVNLTIGDVIARRYGRRDVLSGLGVTTITALFGGLALGSWSGPLKAAAVGHAFRELPAGVDESHHVAEGYEADVLIRWGDPLAPGLPPFDPRTLGAEGQARRFGYNNDYIAFFPLDETGARGLLCVNHEYTSPEVMFPDVGRPDRDGFAGMTEPRVAVEMAAHGVSVVEIALIGNRWVTVLDSALNRRTR